jgi:hypothetical protein
MRNNKSKNTNDSLGSYYAFNRAPAVINYNKYNKSIIQNREFGKVFAEYKDNLIIIDGKIKNMNI